MSPQKDVTLSEAIGKKIRELRLNKYPYHGGQTKCAEDYGTSVRVWNGWEAGRNIPSDENQRKLAGFFGISMAELRGEFPMERREENAPVVMAGANDASRLLETCESRAGFQSELNRMQQAAIRGEIPVDDFVGLVLAVVQASKDYAKNRATRARQAGA